MKLCLVASLPQANSGSVRFVEQTRAELEPDSLVVVTPSVHGPVAATALLQLRQEEASIVQRPCSDLNRAFGIAEARDATHVVVLAPGDRLEKKRGELDPGLPPEALVTGDWRWVEQDRCVERFELPSLSLAACLARGEWVAPACLIPVALWRELDTFDESLGGLQLWDLALRAFLAGRVFYIRELWMSCEVLNSEREAQRMSLRAARDWEAAIAKHRVLFESLAPEVFAELEVESTRERIAAAAEIDRCAVVWGQANELSREIEEQVAALRDQGETRIDWGDFATTRPLSESWGYDRGKPVDRPLIETFLEKHKESIRGFTLEVQENDYSLRFGGERVLRADVLDIVAANSKASVIADLRNASAIADESYDCVVLTQTLHVIDDTRAVVKEVFRILKPGGAVLCTAPAVSRVCVEYGSDGDFWRVTEAGLRTLFAETFGAEHIKTEVFGNVQLSTAFVYGLAAHEVEESVFNTLDAANPTLIGLVARKARSTKRASKRATECQILTYHRVAESADDPYGICVDPGHFEKQIDKIASEFNVLGPEEFFLAMEEEHLPERAVLLTFDDCYVDSLTYAAPILATRGLKALFFATTERLEEPLWYWWDELAALWNQCLPPVPCRVAGARYELNNRDEAYELMVRGGVATRQEVLRRLRKAAPHVAPPSKSELRLDVLGLRELASAGHTIGAHSVHHSLMTELEDGDLRQQVSSSKRTLERSMGARVRAFAYPHGAHDQRTRDVVFESGLEFAFTCVDRPASLYDDRLRLPRRDLHTADSGEIARLLSLALPD